ncbi:hypothetical protein Zmor_020390 [Zophobas morio]|uniref:Uncharacterized protein n=1 Tax=Zophobas morio TaxID=2755281 RepID=A0AA38I6R2_9CUCU|nr:hypothetical protein Zmor_020390 [Zophobas morio]
MEKFKTRRKIRKASNWTKCSEHDLGILESTFMYIRTKFQQRVDRLIEQFFSFEKIQTKNRGSHRPFAAKFPRNEWRTKKKLPDLLLVSRIMLPL